MWGPVPVSPEGIRRGGDPVLEKEQWRRFVSAAKESLELMPVLPDRPLVIRSEYPV